MGRVFPFRARRGDGGAAVLWMAPAVIALAVALAVLPQITRHRLAHAPPLGQVWMATPNTIGFLQDDRVARLFLDRPSSYVLSGGWGEATPALGWASSSRFEVAVARGNVPPDVRTVMYDPESWSSTPIWQRRHPAAAMRLFSETARAAGYRVILTPHPDLVEVGGAGCARRRGESMSAAFLRCRIIATAAHLADVVEIQAQYLGSDPAAYRSFVGAAAAQARAANPRVVVLAGLSTRFASDAQALLGAWASVTDIVDGHYLSVPDGINPEIADGFLRDLAESRGDA